MMSPSVSGLVSAAAAQAAAASALALLSLPPRLLVAVLQWLGPHELARLDRVARALHGPPPPPSLVEQALRQRAAERGALVPAALPAGEASLVQYLSWRERLASLSLGARGAGCGRVVTPCSSMRAASCSRAAKKITRACWATGQK